MGLVRFLRDARGEPRAQAVAHDEVVEHEARLARKHHEGLAGKSCGRHALQRAQRMARGQGKDEVLGQDGFGGELRLGDRRAQQPDLDVALQERRVLLGQGQLAKAELHARERRGEVAQDQRKQRVRGGGEIAHGQAPDFAAPGAPRELGGGAGAREDGVGFLQERGAGVGERHAALRALEQPHPELALEVHDRLRERRLRHGEAPRGAAEMQLVGEGDEVAKGAKLH